MTYEEAEEKGFAIPAGNGEPTFVERYRDKPREIGLRQRTRDLNSSVLFVSADKKKVSLRQAWETYDLNPERAQWLVNYLTKWLSERTQK